MVSDGEDITPPASPARTRFARGCHEAGLTRWLRVRCIRDDLAVRASRPTWGRPLTVRRTTHVGREPCPAPCVAGERLCWARQGSQAPGSEKGIPLAFVWGSREPRISGRDWMRRQGLRKQSVKWGHVREPRSPARCLYKQRRRTRAVSAARRGHSEKAAVRRPRGVAQETPAPQRLGPGPPPPDP